jgi:glycosyltransferase involved in cell wall biosynthesis
VSPWTVDGRALKPPRTGIGQFLASLLTPLSEKTHLTLAIPGTPHDLPPFRGDVICGPDLTGSLWFHRWFGSLENGDALFCPLGVRPFGSAKKSVVVVHALSVLLYPGWQSLKNRITVLPFLSDTVRASHLIVPSAQIRTEVLRYFRAACVTVIPHGWDPSPAAPAWEREPLPDEFFLFLGTLEPRKNPLLLIDAWRRHPQWPPLLLAGGAGWHVRIGRLPANARALGYVTEAEKQFLLMHTRALIYPSSYEGFGLPVLEAAALGVPVIATPVPAAVEYELPSWIPAALKVSGFADAVQIVLSGRVSHEKARVPSWNEIATRYAEVLNDEAHCH